MNTLQKLVFNLVHLAHTTVSDEADNHEAAGDHLFWCKATC